MNNSARLLEGPVPSTLTGMALPMMLGMLSIMLFNVVDAFFVGKLGSLQLAAVSFTFPVIYSVMSVAMGLSIGMSAVVSRAIGEKNSHKIRRLTTDNLVLALVLVTSTAILGYLAIDPIFHLLGAGPVLLPYIRDYMSVWFAGIGFIVIPMVGNAAIRATGDTRSPSVIMMISAVVNMILDPLLIFGPGPFPRWEIKGAAIATLLSYVSALAASLWILGKREKMLTLRPPRFSEALASWKELLFVGLPAAGTHMMMPLSNAVLVRMTAAFGPQAVAAFGVGNRIDSLAMLGIMSTASVLTPFIGQNWGAGKTGRMRQGVNFAMTASLIWGAGAGLLLAALAIPLSGMFSTDPEVVRLTRIYLWIIPVSYGIGGFVLIANSTFNGLQKPAHSAMLIIIRLFVISLPLAWAGSYFWGPTGLFSGLCLGNILVGTAAWFTIKGKAGIGGM